jgi:hypothetical protein
LGRESALALNSLFPDGWFAYGTAAWKVTCQNHFLLHLKVLETGGYGYMIIYLYKNLFHMRICGYLITRKITILVYDLLSEIQLLGV